MPVALEDLRRDRVGLEPESLAGDPLDLGIRRGVRADGAGELADAHPVERLRQSRAVPRELEGPARELEAEGRRLRVDAVRAPDAERVAVLAGARADSVQSAVEVFEQQPPGLLDLQCERRVDHVRGGQPVVEPATLLSELGGHRVDECRRVVLGDELELRDARGRRRARALADRRHGLRRHDSDLRPAVERSQLDVEPARELALLRPDGGHGRKGVAGDHPA